MAFACSNLGGIFHVVLTILGATSGPVVGLFFLGIFFPNANKIGAFVSLALSSLAMLGLSVLSNLEPPYRLFAIPRSLGNSSAGCLPYEGQEAATKAQMRQGRALMGSLMRETLLERPFYTNSAGICSTANWTPTH